MRSKKFKLQGYEQDIVDKYNSGQNLKEIARFYNVEYRVVKRILIEQNIEIRDALISAAMVNRKYYDFFNDINSEDKAYFLGLLSADGTIYQAKVKSQKQIKLSIVESDGYIIEKFKEVGRASQKVVHSDNMATISFCSDGMAEDLAKLGVTPFKTSRKNIPDISNEFMRHYIRGLFDGDGCVYKSSKYVISINFISQSEEFLNNLMNYLRHNNIDTQNIRHIKRDNLYSFNIAKKESVVKFYNLIYAGSNIFLIRKFKKFNKLLKEIYEIDIAVGVWYDLHI